MSSRSRKKLFRRFAELGVEYTPEHIDFVPAPKTVRAAEARAKRAAPAPAPKPVYRRDKDRKGRRADWAADNRTASPRLAWAPRRKGSTPHGTVERTRNGELVQLAANRATRRLLQSRSHHHGSAPIRAQYENT